MSNSTLQLPNSLNLPPHLSAYKYFMVCTLTVAAWDTLVLSPRAWRLLKTQGWPLLKVIFNFLRLFMPAEWIVVAVAFFSTTWSIRTCEKIYLFEPISTAILLASTSAVHVIRIHAIYDRNRAILAVMSLLYGIQIVITVVCCAFYRSVPLLDGQGCIAGPRYDWVGIYWVAPTLLYTVSFGLALSRSFDSLRLNRKISYWKLMLRDGLNLYGSIWLVNLTNVLFWFIVKPTGSADPIKTIITSMAAVLTVSMTLRIILSVRGSLDYGGTFALSTTSGITSSRTTHLSGGRSGLNANNLSTHNTHTYTLDDLRSKPEVEWASAEGDVKRSMPDDDTVIKGAFVTAPPRDYNNGVKITIDKEIGYDDQTPYAK